MQVPSIDTVTTAEQARQLAIDWQSEQVDQSMSYSELLQAHDYFRALGKKFNLTSEFRENGIL